MISALFGRFVEQEDDGAIVVNCYGVGYRVIVSDSDRRRVEQYGAGAELRLWCRTVVTEHSMTIYGFLEDWDRRAFDRIVEVDGVGVATALRILSVMTAPRFFQAVTERDVANLRAIPGIGPKTAAKLCDEVKPLKERRV